MLLFFSLSTPNNPTRAHITWGQTSVRLWHTTGNLWHFILIFFYLIFLDCILIFFYLILIRKSVVTWFSYYPILDPSNRQSWCKVAKFHVNLNTHFKVKCSFDLYFHIIYTHEMNFLTLILKPTQHLEVKSSFIFWFLSLQCLEQNMFWGV